MTQQFDSWVFAQEKWKQAHKKTPTRKLPASFLVIPENWQQPKPHPRKNG